VAILFLWAKRLSTSLLFCWEEQVFGQTGGFSLDGLYPIATVKELCCLPFGEREPMLAGDNITSPLALDSCVVNCSVLCNFYRDEDDFRLLGLKLLLKVGLSWLEFLNTARI
jgi:hypothetical protein